MKNLIILALTAIVEAAGLCPAAFAAPFVTPEMMKRNGLTDEQYEQLWAMGKNPQIDIAAAREWMFRAKRYDNVRDWLDTIGKTNNFAALAARVPDLEIERDTLLSSNTTLRVSAERWHENAEAWFESYTNSLAQVEIETKRADAAEAKAARLDSLRAWLVERRDAVPTQIQKAIYQAIIDRIDANG